jgi:hypothetical protein
MYESFSASKTAPACRLAPRITTRARQSEATAILYDFPCFGKCQNPRRESNPLPPFPGALWRGMRFPAVTVPAVTLGSVTSFRRANVLMSSTRPRITALSTPIGQKSRGWGSHPHIPRPGEVQNVTSERPAYHSLQSGHSPTMRYLFRITLSQITHLTANLFRRRATSSRYSSPPQGLSDGRGQFGFGLRDK